MRLDSDAVSGSKDTYLIFNNIHSLKAPNKLFKIAQNMTIAYYIKLFKSK